jgi:hypothetical protein
MNGQTRLPALPPSNTAGDKLGTFTVYCGADVVHLQAFVPTDAKGNALGTACNPVRTDPTGKTPQPVVVVNPPKPRQPGTLLHRSG